MASFNVNTSNGYIKGIVNYDIVSNQDTNSSDITATFRISRTNSYTTGGTGTFGLSINGNQKLNSGSFSFSLNSNTLVVTHTVTVPHSPDGTKSVVITASGNHSQFTVTSTSETVVLQSVPRGSKPIIYTNALQLGESLLLDIEKAKPHYRHVLKYQLGNSPVTIVQGAIDNEYLWTLPFDLARHLPNSTQGKMDIFLDTYDGGNYISTRKVDIIVVVPYTIVPTTGKITTTELAPDLVSLDLDSFVRYQSIIKVKVEPAWVTLPYGSSVKSIVIFTDNESKEVNTSQEAVLNNVNTTFQNLTINVKITDSRGRFSVNTYEVPVVDYQAPLITRFDAFRSTPAGLHDANGTNVTVDFSSAITELNNKAGTQKNLYSVRIGFRKRTDEGPTEWTTLSYLTGYAQDTLRRWYTFEGFPVFEAFDIYLELVDLFNTTLSYKVITSTKITLALGKDGVGIGKVPDDGIALDVKGVIAQDGINLQDMFVKSGDDIDVRAINARSIMAEYWANFNTLNVRDNAELNKLTVVNSMNSVQGYINLAKRQGYRWNGTINSGSYVDLYHNLGYVPIPQAYNGNGASGVVYEIINNNVLRAKFWTNTGVAWTGSIILW